LRPVKIIQCGGVFTVHHGGSSWKKARGHDGAGRKLNIMDTRTFNVANKLTLTVPASAVKSLDVQPAGKGFAAHVTLNLGGLGSFRARLDTPRLLEAGERDLEDATRWLTLPVFSGTDPVPVLSLTRLGPANGDEHGSTPTPSPAGPGLELK
jgi:hypothetical protein